MVVDGKGMGGRRRERAREGERRREMEEKKGTRRRRFFILLCSLFVLQCCVYEVSVQTYNNIAICQCRTQKNNLGILN